MVVLRPSKDWTLEYSGPYVGLMYHREELDARGRHLQVCESNSTTEQSLATVFGENNRQNPGKQQSKVCPVLRFFFSLQYSAC
uniref:Uncharacterized protein n=1 Tax=Arundo donax TaxID=35708 RepID=A0A0A8XVU6_ARUDO